MSEMEKFIYGLSLLGMTVLFGAMLASIAYSGLEHLCWKYLDWKSKERK